MIHLKRLLCCFVMFCLLLEPIHFFSQPLIFSNMVFAQEAVSTVDESNSSTDTKLVSIDSSIKEMTLQMGDSQKVEINAIYSDGSKTDVSKEIEWEVADLHIVSVSRGKIYAKSVGTTTLVAKYGKEVLPIHITVTAPSEESVQTETEEQSVDVTASEKTNEAKHAVLEEKVPAKGKFALAAAYDGSVTLSKGESYKFTNIHTNATYIKSNATSTKTYDYAIYLPDGSGYDYDTDSKSTSRSIRSGGHMVVTVTSSNPVTFTFTTSEVISEASTTPALLKKEVSPGESFSFVNTGTDKNSIKVEGITKQFSYQTYKEDGTLSTEAYDYVSSTVTIPAGGKIIGTVTANNPVTFAGYYDFNDEEPVSDALIFVTLEAGESYLFENLDDTDTHAIKTDASNSSREKKTYDLAIYKADGRAHAQDADAIVTSKTVPAGGKMVVTATSATPVTFKAFTTYFNGKRIDNPALIKKTLKKEETIQLFNTATESTPVLVNGSSSRRYSYQLFKSDGSTYQQSYDSGNTSLYIPAGGKLIATAISDTPVTFTSYYDLLQDLTSADSIITKTLENGQSYIFVNTSGSNQSIDTDGTLNSFGKRTFNYAIYSGSGDPLYQDVNSGASSKIVPAGGTIVVTVTSELPVTFRAFKSYFIGQDTSRPALFTQTLSKGSSISVTNIGKANADLLTISSGGRFSYQLITNGTVTSAHHNASVSYRNIPANTTILATVTSEEPVTFSGYEQIFQPKLESASSIIQKTLENSQSYEFVNQTDQQQSVDIRSNGSKSFDFVILNRDGSIGSQDIDATASIKHVPPRGKIILTNQSNDPLMLEAFTSNFAGLERTHPVISRETVVQGHTVTFKNNSLFESQLLRYDAFNVVERYDYEIYNSVGSLVSSEFNSTDHSLKVPASGAIKVKVTSAAPITFFGYADHFQIANDSGNEQQVENLGVNSFVDVNKNNTSTAFFTVTPVHSGKHRIFSSPYLNNGVEQDTRLHIYSDANMQNEVTSNDDHDGPFGTKFSKVEWDATANTTYYVKLETAAPSLQSRLTFEEDLDSTRETAIPAEWDNIYTDKLSSPYDIDYFVLTAEEMAYMNLYVTNNMLILEDSQGTTLKTFHANAEDTLFVTEAAGTYYAKVVWKPSQATAQLRSGISLRSSEIGNSYQAGFHGPKRISSNFAVDTTPGFEKSVTIQWRFSNPHPSVKIQVLKQGTPVYEEVRTNLSAGYHTFSWNGIYTKVNPGQRAENGVYYVKVVASDAKQYQIQVPISVVNTKLNEELDIQYLISRYNSTIPSTTIRQAQEDLKTMMFYNGPITGSYNEDFLLSVIAFETILNRSVHVSLNVNVGGGKVLEEKGELTNQLVYYIHAGRATGRDKYGKFAEVLFNGDIIIYETGAATVPLLRLTKIGGKIVKKAGKTIDDLFECNCFTAGTKVLTDEGEKPIEEIKVGDKVLAKDDETGEMAYKEVEWLFQRDVEETYNITVDGEVITTTDGHPFWIVGIGWVEAQHLAVGDVLTTSDGKELAIEKIEVKQEHVTVYNFKVKDFHTYFVSNLGIWTHNKCGVTVNYKGAEVAVYRGGNDFTIKPGEVKIDSKTGLVKTTHGVSLDVNPDTVSKFGGAYRIESLPEGLRIIQRGSRAEHFEIVPAYEMPLEQFQKLLNQITVSRVK